MYKFSILLALSVCASLVQAFGDMNFNFQSTFLAEPAIEVRKSAPEAQCETKFCEWADTYRKEGKVAKAQEYYKKAIIKNDKAALRKFSDWCLERKDIKELETVLKDRVQQRDREAQKELGIMYARQQKYNLAEGYLRPLADESFGVTFGKKQDDVSVIRELGLIALANKDYEKAEHYLKIAFVKDDPEARFGLGRLFYEKNDFEEARLYLGPLASSHIESKALLGNLHLKAKEYDQAEGYLKEMIESGKYEYLYNLGILYTEKNDFDQAEIYLKRSAEQGYLASYVLLGEVYYVQNRYEEARQYLNYAVEHDSVQGLALLGFVHYAEGRHKEAEACFKVTLDKKEACRLALAFLFMEQHRYKEAKQHFQKLAHLGNPVLQMVELIDKAIKKGTEMEWPENIDVSNIILKIGSRLRR